MKKFIQKLTIVLFAAAALSVISGCASAKPVSEEKKLDLRVVILDEENLPVPDFQVYYTLKKGGGKSRTVYTDESGFCSFEGVGEGKYFLCGWKNNFLKMENIEVNLEKHTDIFFCPVTSKNVVFEKTAKLYKSGRYEEGLELMEQLVTEKNSAIKSGVLFYEYYGFLKSGNESESKSKLKELKKSRFKEFYQLTEKIGKSGEENENEK